MVRNFFLSNGGFFFVTGFFYIFGRAKDMNDGREEGRKDGRTEEAKGS
jgi:hypothetical protein